VEASLTATAVYKAFPGLPFLLRHLVDPSPPANSQGAYYRSRTDFEASAKQEFEDGFIQRLHVLGNEFLFEEVKGEISDSQGLLLRSWESTPPMILLKSGQPHFQEKEKITGLASHAEVNVQLKPVGNCWGHSVVCTQSAANDKTFKEQVLVKLPNGRTTVMSYKKHGVKRILDTSPTSETLDKLKIEFLNAGIAHDKDSQFQVIIEGRDDTDNAKERKTILETIIEEWFGNEFLIIDRQQIWERLLDSRYQKMVSGKSVDMRSINWNLLDNSSSTSAWGRTIRKDLADKYLLKQIISEYVRISHPNEEGIFLMHIPGESNGYEFPDSNPRNEKPGQVIGAAYAEATGLRNQTIVYLATISSNKAREGETKSLKAVYNHEVAHALFMPHAPSSFDSSNNPTPLSPQVHVKGDNCLMNYDPDSEHFCGFCMLRMRGWKWEPLKNDEAVQYEYQITLDLGDVNDLYAQTADQPPGLMARLQTLGLFNRPLNHPDSNDCLSFSIKHAKEL
jgi:hypothetical protein